MMVLGIDPSMTGTGVAGFVDGEPIFCDTIRLKSIVADDKGEQLTARINRLAAELDEITDNFSVDLICVERTDWQRNLNGREDWKKQYAIERRNQESLALLQGALCLYAAERGIKFMLLGVNEWHKAFGAGNKEAISELLAMEYPDLIGKRADGKFIWMGSGNALVMDNNQTDAIGIAKVGYDIARRREMETV